MFGIVMFVSDLHPEKAEFPIFVILLGIAMSVSDEHCSNA